jgi:MFS family permease
MKHIPKYILPTIVIAQFFCTSLWFASNGVIHELVLNFGLQESALGNLTSAVQFGFISGTLIFAFLSVADRYSPSKVFFICALLGAAFDLAVIWDGNTLVSILALRFLTGFFLAGIYPVGMKIASDYFEKGLGKSLGFLVGALVIGTAFPHLLKDMAGSFSWKFIFIATSAFATLGGVMMIALVPDGPHRRMSQKIDLSAIRYIFSRPDFRSAAFGYFGHMWELYAFWTFVPIMLQFYLELYTNAYYNIPLLSFLIISIGGPACVIGGYLSHKMGTKFIAKTTLLMSCICCLIAPLIFLQESQSVFIIFLLFWGMVVIADSPLFSTLVAQNAPTELKGTALTIVNSIGFFITIVSIQLINEMRSYFESPIYIMILAIGPILGLLALSSKRNKIISV